MIILIIPYYKENKGNKNLINIGYFCNSIKNGGVERVISLLINLLSEEKKFNHYLITIKRKLRGEYFIPGYIKRVSLIGEGISLIKTIEIYHIDILIYNLYNKSEIKELNKLKKVKIICYDHSSIFFLDL